MKEDTFLSTHREYFVNMNAKKYGIKEKDLNKAIEAYNESLQGILMDDSPYVAEDIQLTLLQAKIDTIKSKYKEKINSGELQ